VYFINKKILEKSASQNKRTPHECQNFAARKYGIQQKVSISENNVGFIEQNYRNFINIYLQFNTDCALKITESSHHLAGNQIRMLILDCNILVCFLHCFRWTKTFDKSSTRGLKWKWLY